MLEISLGVEDNAANILHGKHAMQMAKLEGDISDGHLCYDGWPVQHRQNLDHLNYGVWVA